MVTPSGTDFTSALARTIHIRLAPAGVILPPAGRPVARFTFAPTTPVEGQDVAFDATGSVDCPAGVLNTEECLLVGSKSGLTFEWTFGDGTTGTGAQVTHRYDKSGSFNVTLTVTNDRGNSDRATSFVNVGVSQRPTAAFTFSPTNPLVDQSVFFNASGSTAAAGRTIVAYDWSFGDRKFAEGITATHRFDGPGTWTVTLTVTDDLGKTGTTSQSITVGAGTPSADFTFSPTAPTTAQTVNFDARTSTGARRITKWEWNFGDGATAEGERVSHRYSVAGTYTVVLTVTDSEGARQSVAKTVPVTVP
jgi:PKD repeat protein